MSLIEFHVAPSFFLLLFTGRLFHNSINDMSQLGAKDEDERGSAVGYLNFWALTDSAYKSRSSWTSLAEPTALSLRHLLGLHDFLSFGYEVPEKDAVARPLRLHFFSFSCDPLKDRFLKGVWITRN